jgi:hypothetical protein
MTKKRDDIRVTAVLGVGAALFAGVFVLAQLPVNLSPVLYGSIRYGDLFQMAKIADFKPEIPPQFPTKTNTPAQDAEIIVMGDSFFNVWPGYRSFADQLRARTGSQIHNYNIQGRGETWRKTNPVEYLHETGIRPGTRRTLILGSVDRGIEKRYSVLYDRVTLPKSRDIPPPPNDASPPAGVIERAYYRDGELVVEGWAADHEQDAPVSRVVVTVNGQEQGTAYLDIPRPDVGAFFGRPGWSASGWRFVQETTLFPMEQTVTARFSDAAGNVVDSPTVIVKPEIGEYREKVASDAAELTDSLNGQMKGALKNFDYVMGESVPVFAINEFANTLRFRLFDELSPLTPNFAEDPETLFYREEIAFYEDPLTDGEINRIADNLARIDRELDERYNVEFIFLPMPNKYTIYRERAIRVPPENRFFPKLYAALEKRGVAYIDLYTPFTAAASRNEFVYLEADSHLNAKGMEVVVDETINILSTPQMQDTAP